MNADQLCAWLEAEQPSQRAKLDAIRQGHVERIRALYDDDCERVMKTLEKRLNSPKLAAAVKQLVAMLMERAANPRPLPGGPPPPPPPRPVVIDGDARAQLEAAIAVEPDARDSYGVLGDWLEAQGHPLGALITIGGALAKNPTHAAMLAAHRDHLAAHAGAILGPLAACEDLVTEVEWFMGFIRKARVAYTHDRFNHGPAVAIPDVVGWLLDEPGPGRFLRDLTVGIVRHDDNVYEKTALAIARRPRPALERLFLGDFEYTECELNWSQLGDLTALWPMVPNLRELTLRSGSMTVGPIHLPELVAMTTITGGLDAASLAYIAAADWPALQRFSLQIGCDHEGACTDAGVLEPLLAARRVPALRALGIVNSEFVDELLRRLAPSPLLAQLESIDVSMGTMSIEGVEIIEANRDRFAHVALDVDDNYLPPAAQARLAACVRSLQFGAQRTGNDRRASAYE